MRHTHRLVLILLAAITLPCPAQQAPPITLAQLRAGFATPPPEARLRCYWWWLNGNTDKAAITHDLEEMKAKGFGGVLLVDANGANQNGNRDVPAGPTFASSAWIELYTHALKEADRLGLEITLNITSGWNLGGPDTTPADAAKLLTWTRLPVAGGKHSILKIAQPPSKNDFYRPIEILAYPLHHGLPLAPQPRTPSLPERAAAAETGFSMPDADPMLSAGANLAPDTSLAEIRNITALLGPDGVLTWDPPPGDWEVLSIGYTSSGARVSTGSGAWQGLALDYLSRTAFDTFWNHTVEPLLAAAKPYHSLKYLATDSWELGGLNWTETFAAEFTRRRGYDPLPWLPAVSGRVIDSGDRTARFLTDLRRTVADLVVENHYDVFAAHAAQHHMGIQSESGGPHGAPIDALETFRHAAVVQTEFWSENGHRARDVDRFYPKEAASAAHIYGQRFIAQEGETSIGPQWSESLATDLKPSFDMAITEGMNRLVWHEFTSSPAATGLPGQEYFAGTHINPKITWWNASPAFFTYLNRMQFLMQQGTSVDDVLYFYGDNVPNFVRLKADDPAHALPGYDYDVTDEDALLHTIKAEGSSLTGPSGVTWRALVLPRSRRLSLAALEHIERIASAGATIIGLPPASPTGAVTATQQARFDTLVHTLWGDSCTEGSRRLYAKGQVVCTQNAHAALESMHVLPDVTRIDSGSSEPSYRSPFDYVHKRIGATDLYFIRNGSATPQTYDLLFRAKAATPELWDPVTGAIHLAPNPTVTPDGRTRLPMDLPAFGSIAVVFPDTPQHAEPLAITRRTQPLAASWTIAFQPQRGAPAEAFAVPALTSWTEWPQPGVRFFSGSATYTADADAPAFRPGEQIVLQFDGLREIARIKINGHEAGTVWAQPLTLRVDPWLKPGKNHIEIEVTNLWPNRIIGDAQPGVTEPITQTNITTYHADSPLLPSGIIGPITWLIQSHKSPVISTGP